VAATQQDPTLAAVDQASQVPDVPASGKEKAFGLIGALTTGKPKGGPLDEAIAKHHQQRLDEARMHRRTAASALAIYSYGIEPKSGKELVDPKTGKKLINPETGNAYEDEYLNEWNSAMEHYAKVAGVNKETKAAIQKSKMLAEYTAQQQRAKRQGGGQPGQPAAQGGTPPPPPAPDAASSPAQQTAGPQGGPPPPVPFAEEAPFLRGQLSEQREFQSWKRQQTLLHDFRMEEEAAKVKAQAAARGSSAPPRPVFSRPVSVLDSRTLASHGQVFEDENGDLIDTENIPDTMSLQPFTTRVTETDDDGNSKQVWKTRYLKISPNQKTFTVGNETYGVNPADVTKSGAPTALGEHNVPTTRRTTDPATGQTTVSTSTPKTSGMTGAVPPPPSVPNAATPAAPAKRTGTGTGQKAGAKGTPGTVPLDAEGHIAMTEGTPQVVEGANQLLDGMDVKSLPAKTKELSGSLARKYGWEQGRFTPKEQVMLRESSTFLKEALGNPSMAILDDMGSKLKLSQVLAGGHQNMIGRALTVAASSNMSPQEAEFVRMYNQLVGTVSGLSQLVRSGRATEAQIERLKAELPSILTAKDAADGRARIQRLLQEIDVAMERGKFDAKGGPPSPSAPSGTVRFTEGSQGYNIPEALSKEFQKDHPNAKRQ
jgi:hypothetical protein